MPKNKISKIKKKQFRLVFTHFYHNKKWKTIFEKTFKNLQFQERQAVFKLIKKTHGYGITNTDVDFYFKLPASNQMECFSQSGCSVGSRLNTRLIGDLQIPRKCGDFRFVLTFEKTSRRAKIEKISFNGTRQELQ